MIKNKRILFRLRAGIDIGGGHLSRCITLADALAAQGADITFWCNKEAFGFQNLKSSKYKNFNKDSLSKEKYDLAIIDDYAMNAEDDQQLRHYAHKIMVIDDLANRSHDCDLLLDFSPSRQPEDYKNLIKQPCKIFTGIKYIILRPEFFKLSKIQRKTNALKNIFLTMGSIDGARMLPRVLKELDKLQDHYDVHIMLTSKTQTLDEIKIYQPISKHALHIHENLQDPAEVMSGCDLAISAGGMTCLELVSLGIPTFAIIVADNQIENVTTLDKRNFVKKINNPHEILPAITDFKKGAIKFERMNIGSQLKIVCELEKILN